MAIRAALILASALAVAPATAENAPLPPAPTQAAPSSQSGGEEAAIVVEGRGDLDRQMGEFIKQLPHASSDGHYARFEQATCPAVIGVPPNQAAYVVQRMRKVASAAGVPVGKANCLVNVLVVVVQQKRPFIEALDKRFPDYLGDLSPSQVRRLEKEPARTALWHMAGSAREDGRVLEGGSIEGVPVNRTTAVPSRIRDLAHPTIAGSVLVVEAAALDGVTTTQLSDYAAMRTLTGINPAGLPANSPTTILKVLDTPVGAAAPITMTTWDLAFLKSLYASDPNLFAGRQGREIRAGMRKTLERGAEEPKRR